MKFSVLISIYHKENPAYLIEALDSVFHQTVMPSEVILVKDGPLTGPLDDVIAQYEKEFSVLKVIPIEKNVGLGLALNEGIKYCSYDLIARMDTDDICYPDRFEKQLEVFAEDSSLSFVGAAIAEFTDTISIISGFRTPPKEHSDIYTFAKKKSPTNHAAVMYRKSAVLDSGGYREFPEDYHLWIRALMKGYKFYNIQEPLLYVRFNIEAVKRRGGLNYAKIEVKHQKQFYKMGFLSYPEFLSNSVTRVVVRLIPSNLRAIIYSKLLRSKK